MGAVQQWQAIRPDFSASGRSRALAAKLSAKAGEQMAGAFTGVGEALVATEKEDATNLVNKLVAQGLSPQEAVQTVQTQTATPTSTTKPVQAPVVPQTEVPATEQQTEELTQRQKDQKILERYKGSVGIFMNDKEKAEYGPAAARESQRLLIEKNNPLAGYTESNSGATFKKAPGLSPELLGKFNSGTTTVPVNDPTSQSGISNQSKDTAVGQPNVLKPKPNAESLKKALDANPKMAEALNIHVPKAEIKKEATKPKLAKILEKAPTDAKNEILNEVEVTTGAKIPVSNAVKATNKLQDLLVNGNRYEQAAASKAIIALETMKSKSSKKASYDQFVDKQGQTHYIQKGSRVPKGLTPLSTYNKRIGKKKGSSKDIFGVSKQAAEFDLDFWGNGDTTTVRRVGTGLQQRYGLKSDQVTSLLKQNVKGLIDKDLNIDSLAQSLVDIGAEPDLATAVRNVKAFAAERS